MKGLWIWCVFMSLVFGVTGCKEDQALKMIEEGKGDFPVIEDEVENTGSAEDTGSIEEEIGEEENEQGMWEEEADQETTTEDEEL